LYENIHFQSSRHAAHGITTLAALTVRIPRRRQWWKAVPGLGVASARAIEAFFAAWPALTERARALVVAGQRGDIVPWESLKLPHEVNGSEGTFRAPAATCTLDAANDYEAVQTWLALHESPATQRTYRKEAERLIPATRHRRSMRRMPLRKANGHWCGHRQSGQELKS
jgi:hypothetical protein